jgi:hypothetical protein
LAWDQPKLTADEQAGFDRELACRLENRRRLNMFRLALAGGAFAIILVFVLLLMTIEPSNKPGILADKQECRTEAARHEAISDWMDSLTMPESDEPDVNKIMDQIEKIGMLNIRLRKEQVKLLLAVRKLLSPEQRNKLKELMLRKPHGKLLPGLSPGLQKPH